MEDGKVKFINCNSIEFAWEDQLNRTDEINYVTYNIFSIRFEYDYKKSMIRFYFREEWLLMVFKLLDFILAEKRGKIDAIFYLNIKIVDAAYRHEIDNLYTHYRFFSKKFKDLESLKEFSIKNIENNNLITIEIIMPKNIKDKNISKIMGYQELLELLKVYTIVEL